MKYMLVVFLALASLTASADDCSITSREAKKMSNKEMTELAFSCTDHETFLPGLKIGDNCNLSGFQGIFFKHLAVEVNGQRLRTTVDDDFLKIIEEKEEKVVNNVLKVLRKEIRSNRCH